MEEIINSVVAMINQNVATAPYIIFGLLLLAGFNIPISEDGMLLMSGLLAAKHPEHTVSLFTGVFLGAYLSDLICYGFVGRYLGPKLFKIKLFASMVKPELLERINNFYAKYGLVTLFAGRFIPFGVRNALFLSAGLGKMNAVRFCVADFFSCLVSCTAFFYLYYTYGTAVIEVVKKFNIIFFSVAVLVVLGVVIKKQREKRRKA